MCFTAHRWHYGCVLYIILNEVTDPLHSAMYFMLTCLLLFFKAIDGERIAHLSRHSTYRSEKDEENEPVDNKHEDTYVLQKLFKKSGELYPLPKRVWFLNQLQDCNHSPHTF